MRFWFVWILLVSVGCSNPMEVIVPVGKDSSSQEFDAAMKKLSSEQQKTIIEWTLRVGASNVFGGTPLPIKTIGEALADQEKWREEQKIREEQERIENDRREAEERAAREAEERRLASMRSAVEVLLVDKGFIPENISQYQFSAYITIKLLLRNKTKQNVSGVKGAVVLKNMFGDAIGTITVSIENAIPPNGEIEWDGRMEYNRFIEDHNRMRFAELSSIKTEWIPEQVLIDL